MTKNGAKQPKYHDKITVWLESKTAEFVRERTKAQGLAGAAAYVRELIETERKGGGASAVEGLERKLIATFESYERELMTLRTMNAATLALTDAFVRLFLMTIPEAGEELKTHLRATREARHSAILRDVAHNMTGRGANTLLQILQLRKDIEEKVGV